MSNSSFIPLPSKFSRNLKYEQKHDLYEQPKSSNEARNMILEKDMLIKSQRSTIKLYERKIENLEQNNLLLKQIIGILSHHITEELNDALPPIPSLPDDNFKLAPLEVRKKNFRHKSNSVDVSAIMNSISYNSKVNSQSISAHNFIFDPNMQNNLFQDFHEAEFLKSIVDSQLARDEMQKVMKFLLGKTSQDLFVYKTRTIVFESLSLFLSLRNVAFLNSPEVFLPRMLEMLLDVLEVEKITVFVYEGDSLTSIAVTAELPKAIVVDKTFGHFKHIDEFLVIKSAHEDERFDKQYDQICSFVTRNLACVPMVMEKEVIGYLECCNKKSEFLGEDLYLMGHIAKQLAVAQTGIDIRDKLMSLHQAPPCRSPTIEGSKESFLLFLLNSNILLLSELMSCERINIYLYAQSTKELVIAASTALLEKVKVPADEGLLGLSFSSEVTINTDSNNPKFSPEVDNKTNFESREILIAPIKGFGVVECLNKKNFSMFSKTDEKKIELFAGSLRSMIDSVNKFSSLLYTADVNEFCIQLIRDSLFHVNYQGLIQKLNPPACEFLQSKSEKLIGASLNEALEKFPEILKAFWNFAKKKSQKYEEHVKTSKFDIVLTFYQLIGIEETPSFIMILRII